MRPRIPSAGIPLILVLLVGLLCSACDTPSGTANAGQASATATATIAPTATPLAVVPAATVTQICGRDMPNPAVSIGGIAVAQQTTLGPLAFPLTKLPDNAAQVPMIVGQGNQYSIEADYAHPTNPYLNERGGGYVMSICNLSSTSHTISRVDVRLESVVPYTAQLNEWADCQSAYSRQSGAGGSGCGSGGSDIENEYLHAPFTPDATPGTVVTATQNGTNFSDLSGDKNYGPLPVTLQPGERMTIEVGMGSAQASFSAAGTYTFSFGLGIDGRSPVFAVTSLPTLLATPAHVWSGQACTAPAMQSQIPPATDPPTFYICPAS